MCSFRTVPEDYPLTSTLRRSVRRDTPGLASPGHRRHHPSVAAVRTLTPAFSPHRRGGGRLEFSAIPRLGFGACSRRREIAAPAEPPVPESIGILEDVRTPWPTMRKFKRVQRRTTRPDTAVEVGTGGCVCVKTRRDPRISILRQNDAGGAI